MKCKSEKNKYIFSYYMKKSLIVKIMGRPLIQDTHINSQ